MHQEKIHKKPRQFTCHKCHEEFVHPNSLLLHLKKAHAKVKLTCCPKCFLKVVDLAEHLEEFHSKRQKIRKEMEEKLSRDREEALKMECQMKRCLVPLTPINVVQPGSPKSSSPSNDGKENEIPIQKNSKCDDIKYVIKCSFCSDEFYTEATLDNHVKKIHQGVVSFTCSMCPMTCYKKGTLVKHFMENHMKD